MEKITVITHPLKVERLVKEGSATIVSSESFGPIGLNRCTLLTNNKQSVLDISARPFCFTFNSILFEVYSLDDCISMCSLYLKLRLGEYPGNFEVIKLGNPDTTHLYPIYDGNYLQVCSEEAKLITVDDPLMLLGLRAITHDPLCWINMMIPHAMFWLGGSCVVESRYFNSTTLSKASDTLRYMDLARRRGFRGKITDLGIDEFDRSSARYGPVEFSYSNSLDLLKFSV